jgi:multiple sugar transport system ATP-binding protein
VAAEVNIRSVYKRYEATTVVHGISLDINPGEFVVLVGPSGCGKSTTLRMVAGLEEISDGDVLIDGVRVNNLAPKDRHVAMVFQNYALYPHLNVADNISFGLRLNGAKKAVVQEAVRTASEILGLNDLLERKPADLSGGQRQRVAMGRAIVRQPKVFLFDEPLSNLDAKLRTQMRAEIKRLHARLGTTVIYVTHDQIEAMTLADRIVVMRDGLIEQIGAPMELFNNPANSFVASFIGSPAMNLLPATVSIKDGVAHAVLDEKNGLRLNLSGKNAIVDGQAIVLGIRPEHMTCAAGDTGIAGQKLLGTIDIVEPLGSASIVHARVGDKAVTVSVNGLMLFDIGAAVTLIVDDPANVHVFDAQTQLVIR